MFYWYFGSSYIGQFVNRLLHILAKLHYLTSGSYVIVEMDRYIDF